MNDHRDRLEWFKSVILPHEGALRARLIRLCGARNDVEDIAAEVLARAYSSPRWRGVDHGRAFLFTIARNHLIDQVRREKVIAFEAIADLDLLQSGHELEEQLIARDQLRRLEAVVEAMPPHAAQVFIMRRVEQKSPPEIAEDMGLSVSTVEKHLTKAVRLLMRAMAEQEANCVPERWREEARGDRAAGG